MRKIVAILLFVVTASAIRAEEIRFAIITDIHIGVRGATESAIAVAADLCRKSDIEFVVLLGDITESGTDDEFREADRIFSTLPMPYHVLTGNHDTKFPESGMEVFREFFGNERFCFEYKGYVFTGIPSGPYVHDTAASFLKEDINYGRPDSLPGIFFTHHPLAEITNAAKRFTAYGGKTVAVFGGHLHEKTHNDYQGIPNIICPSPLTSREGQVRYSIIDIARDSLYVTCRDALTGNEDTWYSAPLAGKGYLPDGEAVNRTPYVWKFEGCHSVTTGASLGSDAVYLGNTAGELIKLDRDTGGVVWKFVMEGEIYGIPEVCDGAVYCGYADGTILCLDDRTGVPQWRYDSGYPVTVSLTCCDGMVYGGNSGGYAFALDAATGNEIWKSSCGEPLAYTKPAIASGKICFGGVRGRLYFFDLSDGSYICGVPVSAQMPRNAMTGQLLYSDGENLFYSTREKELIIVDNSLRITRLTDVKDFSPSLGYCPGSSQFAARMQKNAVCAFSITDGSPTKLWETTLRLKWENSFQPPVFTPRYVLVPSGAGRLYVLDRGTGGVIKTIETGNTLVLSASGDSEGQRVVTVSADGSAACYEIN